MFGSTIENVEEVQVMRNNLDTTQLQQLMNERHQFDQQKKKNKQLKESTLDTLVPETIIRPLQSVAEIGVAF